MTATAQRRRPKVDIDTRIERNRQEADTLDRRLLMVRGRAAKADHRPRKRQEPPAELPPPEPDVDVPDTFASPESSIIEGASYDRGARMLLVNVRKGPNLTKEYLYDGYPAEEWVEFVTAVSKGQFFNAQIRPRYQGKAL